jgi:hypothetical protein
MAELPPDLTGLEVTDRPDEATEFRVDGVHCGLQKWPSMFTRNPANISLEFSSRSNPTPRRKSGADNVR